MGWKPKTTRPAPSDCAMVFGTKGNWTGAVWVFFNGMVVQGMVNCSDDGSFDVLPAMPDGFARRGGVTHWHPMSQPTAPALALSREAEACLA